MPTLLARLLLLLFLVMGVVHAGDATAFILKIDTNRTGATNNKTFRLALNPASTYDCTIAWGDGTSTVVTGTPVSDPSRTYSTAGVKTISITQRSAGGFPQVRFANGGDANKVVELVQWGQVDWQSFESAFYGCANMTITATDAATARTGSVTDFSRAWAGCSALTSFPLIDTSAGRNFRSAWFSCQGLTSFPLVDTSNGTDFRTTWYECRALTSFPTLDTGKGVDFTMTWFDCRELTGFPALSLGSATELNQTWGECRKLTAFPLLDTSRIVKFYGTWRGCTALISFPLLDVSNGTDFSLAWSACTALTVFPFLNVANGVDFTNAWSSCTGLTTFPALDLRKGTNFTGSWEGCRMLASFPLVDTRSGTDFTNAWAGCTGLTSFPLIKTSSAIVLSGAWRDCYNLTAFPKIDTAKVMSFDGAWSGCQSLASFPLLNTSKGTDFSETWSWCYALKNLPDLDLRNMTNGNRCFFSTQLSTDSYSQLLIRLAATNLNRDVVFDGGNSFFHDTAESARNTLLGRNWTITDYRMAFPSITSPPIANMTRWSPYSYQITAIESPRRFYASPLPEGLSINNDTGLISGTPTGPIGITICTLEAHNGYGNNSSMTLYISVRQSDAPQITSPSQASGSPDSSFSYQITAINSPTSFGASLPVGLSVDSTTGLISGTMTDSFFGNVVISATNVNGTTYGYFKLTMGTPPDAGGGGGTGGGSGGGGGGCGMGGGTAASLLLGFGLWLLHGPGSRRRRGAQASSTSRGK